MQTNENENKKISVANVLSWSLRILLGAIIAFLVFAAAVLAYDKYVKKSAIPSFFGKSLLVIATPSMSGSVEAGDAIIIEKKKRVRGWRRNNLFPRGGIDFGYAQNSEDRGRQILRQGRRQRKRRPRPDIQNANRGQNGQAHTQNRRGDRMVAHLAGYSVYNSGRRGSGRARYGGG